MLSLSKHVVLLLKNAKNLRQQQTKIEKAKISTQKRQSLILSFMKALGKADSLNKTEND